MKKENRLLKNYQFRHIINHGKLVIGRDFFVYFVSNVNSKKIQIGISVPHKTFKKAFLRNKVKRQIKNMLIDVKKDWAINIVIIVRKDYLLHNYTTNQMSLKKLLKKISLKAEL